MGAPSVSTLSINTVGQTATTIGSTTAGSVATLQSNAGNVTVNNAGVSIQGTTPNSQINIGTTGGQVNIGNSSGGSTVNFNNNRLTGVAAGINGTDAVNVNQLNSAVNNLQNQINTNKAAIAGVVAATNLPGLQNGQTVNFGIAWGNYSNQNGMSIGGHVRLAEEVVLKVSGSATSGVYSGGVGLGIGF